MQHHRPNLEKQVYKNGTMDDKNKWHFFLSRNKYILQHSQLNNNNKNISNLMNNNKSWT